MNRNILQLALAAVLLSSSAVWAQTDSNPPQVPPPPSPAPALPPGTTPPDQPALPPPTPWVVAPGPTPWVVPGEIIAAPATPPPRWVISADALWLERTTGACIPLGFTAYNFASHASQALPTDKLYSDDVFFPLAAGVRLQLSRRVNDQTTIEAIFWGLQQWSIGRTIYADPLGDTVLAHSRWLQTSALIGGLNSSLGYSYSSQVDNAEINLQHTLGLYNPYWAFGWLWGFRYFHLSDDFTLTGSDLDFGDYENLRYQTNNNLVGMQAGLHWRRGWDRFQVITEVKAGLFANFDTQQGNDSATGPGGTPPGFTPLNNSYNGTDLAALFELSLVARCRITSCTWLRAGYQVYCVTGLALAPQQLGGRTHDGTVVLDGLSVGLETAW